MSKSSLLQKFLAKAAMAITLFLPKRRRFICTLSKFLCYRWRIEARFIPNEHTLYEFGKQNWRSGESARLQPMWSGFYSRPVPCVGRVYCWLSPCSEGFSAGSPVFLSPENQHSKFQFDRDTGPAWQPAKSADVASSLNIIVFAFAVFFFAWLPIVHMAYVGK